MGFRPFPILHDEGTVSALSADNNTHFNFNIRCGRGLDGASRWRADPNGTKNVYGVGIPPISPY